MAACLSLTFYPTQSSAVATVSSTSSSSKSTESTEARALLFRLTEIKSMDKSNLTPADKKSLRNEVLSIKERLSTLDGGIYLSVGAVIIILLLLIILL